MQNPIGRKVVWNILQQKIRNGEVEWIARNALTGLRLKVEKWRRSGHSPSPIMAVMVVTENCNLRCPMCELPERFRINPNQLGTDVWLEVIDQLAELKVAGIGITGGEPTLRRDIFDLIGRARGHHGIPVTLNTNILPLKDSRIDLLMACPPTNINISIDSGRPEMNDQLRGGSNVLARTLDKIRLLVEERKQRGAEFTITAVAVLSDDNIEDLDVLFQKVSAVGVDRIGFMPLHTVGKGVLSVVRSSRDTSQLLTRLQDLSRKYELPLENSQAYLRGFHPQMSHNPGGPVACNAGYTSIVIGPHLELYRCWPFFEKEQPLRQWDVNGPRLNQIWNDDQYRADRLDALGCDECYWNCHWELNHLVRM